MNAILGFFAKIIGYPMVFFYNTVGNYPLAIVMITLLVRLVMLPLYSKQMKQSAKMAELQPKVQEIQTRYARDRAQMQEKMNELYQDAGVNTVSGCLPMLIQFPIMLGLYQLLRDPLTYMKAPEMLAAVHESLFWIPDLSQPDAWVLPILAGITTYLTTALSTSAGEMGANMKGMTYFMPLMIFLLGRSFPAALALYWVVGNLFQVLQTLFFKKRKSKEDLQKEVEAEVLKRKKAEKQ